jgi:hypothetical protein
MRLFLYAAGVGLAAFLSVGAASAQTTGAQAYERAFGPCAGHTCVIRSSPGGEVRRFLAASAAVLGGAKRLVVIDGPCYSACAIFADVAREKVCVTDRAAFGFHKATVMRASRGEDGRRQLRPIARHDPRHSSDIDAWVRNKGGFPARGFQMMSAREAAQFWRRCELRGR